MDYKLSRETFTTREQLLDISSEQAVELDYVLPDYCPEIFKVLCCKIIPSISERNLSGTKLSYGLNVLVRVSYVSESGEISAVEQTLSYDKTAELPKAPNAPVVHILPFCSAKSCRVVNKRRIDVRGVVSVMLKVLGDCQTQAVSGAMGGGLQLRKTLITYPSRRICITKRVSVVDEVEIISSKPPIGVVLGTEAGVSSCDKKVLSGKLLTKGEAEVTVLYVPEGGGDPEKISFELPFSQVSDVEGLDERCEIFADASVACCEIRPLPKSEPAKLECELKIDISCLALKFESARLADDVFSTEFEASADRTECRVECAPSLVNESHRVKSVLTYSEGEIKTVLSASCEPVGPLEIIKKQNGGSAVSGRVCITVYAKNESGKPVCLESEVRYEHTLPDPVGDCAGSDLRAVSGTAAYNLSGSNAIEVTADIKLRGYICEAKPKSFISDVRLDESKPVGRDRECSLKLYYSEPGESAWDIAKRTKASLQGILDENEIDGEGPDCGRMLLIPID